VIASFCYRWHVPEAPTRRQDVRARIIDVAARLLREQGPAAVTTRGVAEAAGVQAPAIYRLFGDKDGLLEAVAEYVMAGYVAAKTEAGRAAADVDPIDDLRAGWQTQIDFSVTNPALFRLFSDPARVRDSAAAQAGRRVLEGKVHRVAATGRLRVSEQRAVDLIEAAGIGAIQVILSTPPERRDPSLADDMFDAVRRQILTDAPGAPVAGPTATAVTFRALAPGLDVLTEGERRLLTEWLDRVIDGR
jgi:AcrR family transcriptional regulator